MLRLLPCQVLSPALLPRDQSCLFYSRYRARRFSVALNVSGLGTWKRLPSPSHFPMLGRLPTKQTSTSLSSRMAASRAHHALLVTVIRTYPQSLPHDPTNTCKLGENLLTERGAHDALHSIQTVFLFLTPESGFDMYTLCKVQGIQQEPKMPKGLPWWHHIEWDGQIFDEPIVNHWVEMHLSLALAYSSISIYSTAFYNPAFRKPKSQMSFHSHVWCLCTCAHSMIMQHTGKPHGQSVWQMSVTQAILPRCSYRIFIGNVTEHSKRILKSKWLNVPESHQSV